MRPFARPGAPWRPIVDGEAAREATGAVEAIAAALPDEPTSGHSLAGGTPGLALLYA